MKSLKTLITMLVFFCLGNPAVGSGLSQAQTPGSAAQETKPGASAPCGDGPANAAVSVEVFNDYQCPVCERFNKDLNELKATYKGRVRIIYRNFPLKTIHQNAFSASQAAEAAGLQGKFVEMMNLLYDQQDQWRNSEDAKQLFVSYARKLHLDAEKFAADMDSEAVRERIDLDVERGRSLGVTGTPTVFVNGNMVSARNQTGQAIKDALSALPK